MLGKIKALFGKVKEFFIEKEIDAKAKAVVEEGIQAVKKGSEELKNTMDKVSEDIKDKTEKVIDTSKRVVDAVKNKPDVKATEKVIDEATHSHATADLAKDIGLSPICSTTDVTTEASKEADKIRKEKVSKTVCKKIKDCDSKTGMLTDAANKAKDEADTKALKAVKKPSKKCVIDEVAAEKSEEATAPKYKIGAYTKTEVSLMQSLIKDGTTDPKEIAAVLHRNPLSVAKKVKQVMNDMQLA